LKIKKAEFIKSAFKPSDFLIDKPAIAFVGRSNVGKSSLINGILNRKSLAKTSSTPGKTRLANYFLINDSFYFVDLPGLGYASVSAQGRRDLERIVTEFVAGAPNLIHVLHVVDIRHDPTPIDLNLKGFLDQVDVGRDLILTKSDKLNNSKIAAMRKKLSEALQPGNGDTYLFSKLSGRGRDELLQRLGQIMNEFKD
jgi:GTP-binding protein